MLGIVEEGLQLLKGQVSLAPLAVHHQFAKLGRRWVVETTARLLDQVLNGVSNKKDKKKREKKLLINAASKFDLEEEDYSL